MKMDVGTLTLLVVVVVVVLMAQAALVSHMKLAVQFWYIRKRGLVDWAAWSKNIITLGTSL